MKSYHAHEPPELLFKARCTLRHGQNHQRESGYHHPPPSLPSPQTPWLNSIIEECATWLRRQPLESLNGDAGSKMFFLAMNEFLAIEDSVLVCCWKLDEHGNVEVEYFPQPPEEVEMQIMSNNEPK
jgi:hypothetical protein